MIDLMIQLIQKTALQLLFWGLPLLVLGVVIQRVAGEFTRLACRKIGVRGYLLLFGWLGTAVHELSHAAMAVLFRHKIDGIKLFRISPKDNNLGFVRHRHDNDSIYQRSGNFFIGVAPVVIGALVIWLAALLLAPGILPDHATIGTAKSIGGFLSAWISVLAGFLQTKNFKQMEFYLFLYLLFAIGSAMKLSAADLKGAGTGAALVLAMLIAVNAVELIFWSTPVITALLQTFFAFIYNVMMIVLILHLIILLPLYLAAR